MRNLAILVSSSIFTGHVRDLTTFVPNGMLSGQMTDFTFSASSNSLSGHMKDLVTLAPNSILSGHMVRFGKPQYQVEFVIAM